MCGLDRTPGATNTPDDMGEDGTSAPCPLCGHRHPIKDTVAAGPQVHDIHQCPKCGCRFGDMGPVCPRCGFRGEILGDIVVPDGGLYVQYRCRRCGHGFIFRG